MRAECIQEIALAIGRNPTKAEADAFEAGLLGKMRELARSEPKWREMTGQQKLQAAAELAQTDALAHADKVAERRASNLLAQARESQRLLARAQELGGTKAHHKALFERLRQVDDYVSGVRNEILSDLVPAIQAVEPRFFGLMDDPAKVRQFAKAVMDGDATDAALSKAAKVYTDAMERVRVRANAAGADIGKLDYGYLPQPHDSGKIARTGAEAWAQSVLPKLDRSRYVDATGNPMGDAEVLDMLRGAWDTIATEGLNQRVPGQRGQGSRASRFDDAHRAIHFKDGDAYSDYMAEFGRGSALQSIHAHAGMMAKTIGMMEEFGANPTSTYRLLKDTVEKADRLQGAVDSWDTHATLDMVWDTLNGTTAQPVNANMARFFQGNRNFTVMAKLQGLMLSAITDAPLQVIVARSNGIPTGEAIKSLFAGVGGDKKALAYDLAIGMDELGGEMARWHQDHIAQGWTAKLANTTMRATLVQAWTDSLRRGFALTLSRSLDRMRATDWEGLGEYDKRRLSSAGITEADWKIWQAAPSQEGMLTKHGIRAVEGISEAEKNRATARLLGYLDQEAHTAVLAPDLMTRAFIQQGTKAGTLGGETLRSVMLFKSFAFGIVQKHLRRIRDIPTTQGKVAYSAAMMTSLTLFGAVSVQLKDMVQGKDPRDMTESKFWTAAFLQGGGVGILGDVFYTGMGGNARGGQANWTSLLGPVFGNAADALDLTIGNVYRAAQEKETQFGADALRFARSNLPFVNLWYLRAATDHLVLHDLQEQVSPGYLRKMKRRAQKEWGQGYWWEPGESAPDRAPDVANAAGGE